MLAFRPAKRSSIGTLVNLEPEAPQPEREKQTAAKRKLFLMFVGSGLPRSVC